MCLGWVPRTELLDQFSATLKLCVLITVQIGIVMKNLWDLCSRIEQKELERERALKLATEAKLSALHAPLHPHFLLNALNSISALIQEDPVRADQLVERMAALLRVSLESSQEGLIPLSDELKIVEDYLEIEKARFGKRLSYRIHIPRNS